MSPKSRKRSNRDRRPKPPESRPPYPAGSKTQRLTGELQRAFEALVSGLALLARAPDPFDPELTDEQIDELASVHEEFTRDADGNADEPMDVLAASTALTQLVGITTRALARALLERALGRKSNILVPNANTKGTATPSRAEMLDELSAALRSSERDGEIELPPAVRRSAIDEAAAILREVGLEEFDVACVIVENRDGTFDLEAIPVSRETAHIGLIEFLFDRAESVITAEPLLAAERLASEWEFSRWSAAPTPGALTLNGGSFTQQVREQEYSLVRRPTVTLGSSIVGEIATDDVFAELFPREHRMARALVESFVGIFECVALDGHRAKFKSARDGQTFDVYEHMVPAVYKRGYIGLGRLIPFDDASYLRSPGMIFGGPPIEPLATTAVNAFDELCASLSPDLALEAVIANTVFGVRVPREVKPARSRTEARELLIDLIGMLLDAPEPDNTLDEFMDALDLQAGPDSKAPRPPKHASKSKKAKQKTKRLDRRG